MPERDSRGNSHRSGEGRGPDEGSEKMDRTSFTWSLMAEEAVFGLWNNPELLCLLIDEEDELDLRVSEKVKEYEHVKRSVSVRKIGSKAGVDFCRLKCTVRNESTFSNGQEQSKEDIIVREGARGFDAEAHIDEVGVVLEWLIKEFAKGCCKLEWNEEYTQMGCGVPISRLNERHAQMDCGALVLDSSTALINLRYVESVDCETLMSCAPMYGQLVDLMLMLLKRFEDEFTLVCRNCSALRKSEDYGQSFNVVAEDA